MGCAKNIVDSEKLMAQLQLNDIEVTDSIEDADIAVINTCGFIDAAKEESIDMIIANVQRKANGKLKKVYAIGCLTERYMVDLEKEIPEVDKFFGSSNNLSGILKELGAEYKYELLGERAVSTPRHFAYIKISEGCDNPCSFCAIPIMRGKHAGRSMEDVVAEARLLAAKGVKELVVIGQDTTYFGLDTRQTDGRRLDSSSGQAHGRRMLPELLQSLGDVDGIEWVRLMYAYPAKFPKEVLDAIAQHPKICKYMDMPVQHVADEVLKSMRRGISQRALRELIDEIRTRVPDITLRTTMIVGYPTETVKEFDDLLKFMEEVRFDRLGVFTYSVEDGTTAYGLGDPVSRKEKERRRSLVMELQREISEEKNQLLVGSTQKVLIDRVEAGLYVGRTERDAPEIDNEVYVRSDEILTVGDFHQVAIESASEYDLYACLKDRHARVVEGKSTREQTAEFCP